MLHESMLDSVVYARQRWLAPGGLMLPRLARVLAAPVNMSAFAAEKFGFWADVCGFDLSNLAALAAQKALAAPLVTDVTPAQLLAPPAEVAAIDLDTVTVADLQAALGGSLRFTATQSAVCHGFAIWFEVVFPAQGGAAPVVLSTAPDAPRTHWQQTVLFLPEMLQATAGETQLDCRLLLQRDTEQPRFCMLDLEM